MSARVLEQIAHEPTQHAGVAPHAHRLAAGGGLRARRLFRHQREQVDLLEAIDLDLRVEPAREQQLADQLVELGDVLLEAPAQLRTRVARQQLDRHPDARERRAQLVGSAREQSPAAQSPASRYEWRRG